MRISLSEIQSNPIQSNPRNCLSINPNEPITDPKKSTEAAGSMASSLFLFTFSLFFFFFFTETTSFPAIGVTYDTTPTSSDEQSSPSTTTTDHVPTVLQSIKMTTARLPDSDPKVVRAFSYSNVSLLLTIPNNLVPAIASNRSNSLRWLYQHVIPFYPRAKITTISVGNDILEASPDVYDSLLPAVRNIHLSLRELGISKISVSTTFSFINIMTMSFPPSAATFQEPASENLIKPLLNFLDYTNSSFLINVYPYNLYRLHSQIPIGFALFQETPFNFRDDLTTGVRYRNLFDMMVDAVISAMAVAGHENIPVIVTETGWPSSGEVNEMDANEVYAEMYLKGLLAHLRSGIGTPLRQEGVAETYIYELFDRDIKQGIGTTRRQWGLLYPNMTKKYNIDFSGSARNRYGGGLVMAVAFLLLLLLQNG